jgi:hypothetical protein
MSFALKTVMSLSKLAFIKSTKPTRIPKYLVPFPLSIYFNCQPQSQVLGVLFPKLQHICLN